MRIGAAGPAPSNAEVARRLGTSTRVRSGYVLEGAELDSANAAVPSYVVIGTSAGGVDALTQIFKDLPAGFPGAFLVVVHSAASSDLRGLGERFPGRGTRRTS